ncbi:kinase-like domain-containing protein, partial [Flammula alnicola]
AEGQTLWALRQFLPEVRVPEVYGWRREGVELFLFMELIEGETLMHRWKELTEQEKTAVCAELGPMVRALHRLKRPPEEEEFIAIGRQPSMDSFCFGLRSDAFPNSEAFYECFMRRSSSDRERAHKELGLPHLPYDSPIVFTHGDLNFSNIMITPRSVKDPPSVVAIVDWEQSGWMPSFWEYSKPRF